MIEFYDILFFGAMIYLALITFGYLFRSLLGPTFFDRILGVNSISTIIILIICILSVVKGESYIVDIALVYAMLSFITVVIVCKAYLRSHKRDKSHDFENIRGEELKDD